MADKKISTLTSLTTPASPDLLVIIDDANGTPTSKKITLKALFGAVPSNTAFAGLTTLTGNTTINSSNVNVSANVNIISGGILKANNLSIAVRTTPSTNNALSESLSVGQMFFSNTHLYIAVNRTTIKRVALSVF